MKSKISNQCQLLLNTRMHDEMTKDAISQCKDAIGKMESVDKYETLMGIEGITAKKFFAAYFQAFDWHQRAPRAKCDVLNATLDIGYTVLFNFIEVFARMFGFDPYIGVYHRLWFRRKSLICDLMEPFRCIIDVQTRKGFNLKQFKADDFECRKGEFSLKFEKSGEYYKVFYTALIERKRDVFEYIREYYRCFMQSKPTEYYPIFNYQKA